MRCDLTQTKRMTHAEFHPPSIPVSPYTHQLHAPLAWRGLDPVYRRVGHVRGVVHSPPGPPLQAEMRWESLGNSTVIRGTAHTELTHMYVCTVSCCLRSTPSAKSPLTAGPEDLSA